jgi:hypothetical protein
MLAAEHAFQLDQIDTGLKLIKTRDHLLVGLFVILLLGHIKEHLGIFQLSEIFVPDSDQILQLAQLSLDLFGFGLVIPEIRADRLPLQQLYLFTLAI